MFPSRLVFTALALAFTLVPSTIDRTSRDLGARLGSVSSSLSSVTVPFVAQDEPIPPLVVAIVPVDTLPSSPSPSSSPTSPSTTDDNDHECVRSRPNVNCNHTTVDPQTFPPGTDTTAKDIPLTMWEKVVEALRAVAMHRWSIAYVAVVQWVLTLLFVVEVGMWIARRRRRPAVVEDDVQEEARMGTDTGTGDDDLLVSDSEHGPAPRTRTPTPPPRTRLRVRPRPHLYVDKPTSRSLYRAARSPFSPAAAAAACVSHPNDDRDNNNNGNNTNREQQPVAQRTRTRRKYGSYSGE